MKKRMLLFLCTISFLTIHSRVPLHRVLPFHRMGKTFDRWSYALDFHRPNTPMRAFNLYQRYSLPVGIGCSLFAARKVIYKHKDHFPVLIGSMGIVGATTFRLSFLRTPALWIMNKLKYYTSF